MKLLNLEEYLTPESIKVHDINQWDSFLFNLLEEENIYARVIDMHTIKPIDREIIIKAAKETGAIVTVEEHNTIGGLGSAVAEVLVQTEIVPVEFVGVQENIVCKAKKVIERK